MVEEKFDNYLPQMAQTKVKLYTPQRNISKLLTQISMQMLG